MNLAQATEEALLWQVALTIGAIVVVAVIGLLGLLLFFVRSIETNVQRLGGVARRIAGNTANIKLALVVADSLDEVVDEAGRHARLLGVGT
jgi:heme/copper-type cytochrome/quinol oxidase subunit 2